jgi:carboxyl-terminal processing protease
LKANKKLPYGSSPNIRKKLPNYLWVLALALLLLPSLFACGYGQSPQFRVLDFFKYGGVSLSEEAQKELNRFKTIYRAYSNAPDMTEQLDYFDFAFRRVLTDYVREVSEGKLIDAAIKGVRETKAPAGTLRPKVLVEAALISMAASLDPHSSFLTADEFRETFVRNRGEFGGLGIQITLEDNLVKVISPIEDTPAAKAGIMAGDLITHVDGVSIQGKTLTQAVKRMRGRAGTMIILTIRREGQSDFKVQIIREIITVKAVRWRVEKNIGYIRIARFSEKMEDGIEAAMAGIYKNLGSKMIGIVLDLRNNPGGLLDQSLVLADSFLEEGEIVSVRGRDQNLDRSHIAHSGDLAKGLPMVVLINSGSASASEIVASALQVHNRAIVMGTRSFGKGSVQTILPMPVEGGLKLTTSLYYAPSGHTIQARGVMPDIIINPKKAGEYRHETDLPNAFPAIGKVAEEKKSNPQVSEETCPPAGEKKDHGLGCALVFLHAGSTQKFISIMKQRIQNNNNLPFK